jgi:REP element-mobilizing transposase RayT
MHPPKEFRDDHTPFGYLITFRCYGTWLHGTKGSVDRFHNTYGTPTLAADKARWRYNRRALVQPPVKLKRQQRRQVEEAIRETCDIRKWSLWVSNVRTNHVHVVVTANCAPDKAMNAFKANATRKMREGNCWTSDRSPWAYGGSKRYLWSDEELVNAIAYVREDQGEDLD